jgi:hypothetical protein
MKKTLMPLLIAAAVALSACGQDLSGGDWRTTGVVQAAGTISRSGADTDVLVCVHEGDAVFYRDSADQELFGQVVYPMDVQDPWDTFAAIDFADRNGDGDGDVAMTFTDSEGGDVWMVWFWDADTGEYVFQPEESGSTVTAEWLRWEDLAEDCTTWQGEDGGMLALRADEALYTYRTWYGRTGQGDLWDIGNRQVLLRYGDGSYLLARSGSGFTLRSLEGSMGELDSVSYVPADSDLPEIPLSQLDGMWQNALGETLLIDTARWEYIACSPEGLASGTIYDREDGRGPYLFLNGFAYPRLSQDGSSLALYVTASETQAPDGSYSGVFYRDGDAAAYADLTQSGFSEDGGRLWYYDGAEYFAVPEGYAVGQDGRAYDANGKVYAAGWESPVYDPGTDWGPDWDQSWD